MQTARATMERCATADRLRGALSHPGTNVPFVSVGEEVWFHSHRLGWLRGSVHSLDGKTVYVRRDGKLFSSHEARTKPFVARSLPPPLPPAHAPPRPAAAPASRADPVRTHAPAPPVPQSVAPSARGYLARTTDPGSPDHRRWDASKQTELAVFYSFDCKTTIFRAADPAGEQVFYYLWLCTWKEHRRNWKPPARSRFCIAGHREKDKANDVPTSPVTPHRAIRTCLAATSVLGWSVHTEDFLRAYLQSDILPKPIYVHARRDAHEPDDAVWAFTRPMYGKSNAGRNFFFSTQAKFLTIPGARLSEAFDTVYVSPLHGCLSSYVDDTLAAGTPAFLRQVAAVMQQYKTHRPDHDSIVFSGIAADADADDLYCHSRPYAADLVPLDAPPPANAPLANAAGLHSLAAQILWIGRLARPDVLNNAAALASLPSPTTLDAGRANDTIAILTNRDVTLHFPRLDPSSLRLSIYADYSGSTLSPLPRRQVGYLVLLTDASARFCLLHWASHGPHRVSRGSTAGDLFALADAVPAALDVRLLLHELLSRRIPMDAYIDSATAYELGTSFKDPAEISGKNDLYMLRRALLAGTLSEINHICGADNPADALSKPTFSRPPPKSALSTALASGNLSTPIVAHATTDGYRKAFRSGVALY